MVGKCVRLKAKRGTNIATRMQVWPEIIHEVQRRQGSGLFLDPIRKRSSSCLDALAAVTNFRRSVQIMFDWLTFAAPNDERKS